MNEKKNIRSNILEQRNALSLEEVNKKSSAIFEKLRSMRQYTEARIIMAYMDFKNEVRTVEFIRECIREGKRIVLPKVIKESLSLSLYEIKDMDKDIIPGFKGIPEPNSETLTAMNPEDIDLAVIPGVAFDEKKNRLGYGAGYYDRFLKLVRPDCVKAGVAFRLQLLKSIPVDTYDIPMDVVVTEDLVI